MNGKAILAAIPLSQFFSFKFLSLNFFRKTFSKIFSKVFFAKEDSTL